MHLRLRSLLVTCIAFVATVALYADRAADLCAELTNSASKTVLVASHRGDWRDFPENSIPAIESAIKMGVDIVELDLDRTKDGVLFLMHDRTLERTTNGKGKGSEITFEALKKLRLKNGCGVVTRYEVPTLEEAMLAAKGRILVNLDKAFDFLPDVMTILNKTGTAKQVIIKSYHKPVEQALGANAEMLKQMHFMPIIHFGRKEPNKLAQSYLDQIKPPAMEIVFTKLNDNVMKGLQACSSSKTTRLWVNIMWPGLAADFNDDDAMEKPDDHYGWMLKNNVTIIQTDRPALLIAYLRKHGRHQ